MHLLKLIIICFLLAACIKSKQNSQIRHLSTSLTSLQHREMALCQHKDKQSPIIISSKGKKAHHKLKFEYTSSHEVIKNLGHTVELIYDKGSKLIFNDVSYQLVQFHFHTPSEHHINTQVFPMEMHLVHQSIDSSYLVLSVLFQEKKDNKFLSNFIPDIPSKDGDTNISNKKIDLTTFFPNNKVFYTYGGSLTTPPYTEGVRWIIFQEPVDISREQIEVFKKLEGFNARESQPVNNRKVEIFKTN
jgi:carbonic anhydrase